MSTEMKLTENEVKVLVYVKLLEETQLEDCPNYTVGQKLEAYGNEPLDDIDGDEFNAILDKFCSFGIMQVDDVNNLYELTETGKEKLKELPLHNIFSDGAIKTIWNMKEWSKAFLQEHGKDIISVVSKMILH